jgi:hypothetical protein
VTPLLTAERLRALVSYDPATGVFVRRQRPGKGARSGQVAGSLNKRSGYVEIGVDGRSYWAQRLAWLYVHGEWPACYVSFRDGNGANVAIANLYERQALGGLEGLSDAAAAARVRELLAYDRATGVFLRRSDGEQIGLPDATGYGSLTIDGEQYRAHRIAWLYVCGAWPAHGIDHRDGDKGNNRFLNLRDADQRINTQNQRRARADNQAGLIGAHFRKDTGKFASRIKAQGRNHSLGSFVSAEQAHAAYVAAKRKLHEGNTL